MTAEYMAFVLQQVIETAEVSPEKKGFVVSNLHAADHSLQIAEETSGFEFEKGILVLYIDLTDICFGGIVATGAAPEVGSWSWMGKP